jgi:hypothetical protein
MAREGILLGALTFSLSLIAALTSIGFAPAEGTRKRNETEMEVGMTSQAYSGLWVTADGFIRHELLPDGRYIEARGERERAYEGQYWLAGDHIEYRDDTGFIADGDFRDGILYHAGMVFYRRDSV